MKMVQLKPHLLLLTADKIRDETVKNRIAKWTEERSKKLVKAQPNVSYISSRPYRAPELIFGATEYTSAIDLWSGGSVITELVLQQPIFAGDSSLEQIVEIIKVLGTPNKSQIISMNPEYTESELLDGELKTM